MTFPHLQAAAAGNGWGGPWAGSGWWASGWSVLGLLWIAVFLLFWAGLIAILIWAVRASSGRRRTTDATEILRRRLAAGEISREEYEWIQRLLRE